jgi:hypothetical protein
LPYLATNVTVGRDVAAASTVLASPPLIWFWFVVSDGCLGCGRLVLDSVGPCWTLWDEDGI